MTFTKERIIEELKSSTQNASGMFEISEDTICALMSLLTAPPAPVVPDALPDIESEDGNDIDYMEPSEVYALGKTHGWNACRAAMLQGAEPVSQRDELPAKVIDALEKALQAMSFMGDTLNALDAVCEEDVEYVTPAFEAVREVLEGNSPAIPDGWVACSERMPLKRVNVLVFDAGGNKFICCHENGFWRDYRVGFSRHEIVYWMPLPAAPQQEA